MNSFQLLRIKIHIECTLVWNKLPVNHTFKIPPDTQHYFGAEPIFNVDFGRLTGSEPTFRGVRVVVIDQFSITWDCSPDKSIIHGITDKPTTDIHSRWVCWGVYSWGTDLQLLHDFPSVLIWWCMLSIDAPNPSDSLWVPYFFVDFPPKLCIYSHYHN